MSRHKNVRSSAPNTIQYTGLRNTPSSLQEEIHLFLEGRNILDILVSQPVRSLESFQQTQKIFVAQRLGPVPSGFLILRSDSPVIYWNTKTGSAHIVKICFDRRQLEKIGSVVFSATYYGNERKMILEDVLYYNGSLTWNMNTFTERWGLMKNICKNILKPDISGIQGFELEVVKLQSLSSWIETAAVEEKSAFMWEFIIDKPRTRRLLWREYAVPVERRDLQKDVTSMSIMPRNQVTAMLPQTPQTTATPSKLFATIEKDTLLNLPDSYVLYAADHKPIGSAALKKLTISLALRAATSTAAPSTVTKVHVQYNDTFKKYEVLEVVDNNEPLASLEFFEKRT